MNNKIINYNKIQYFCSHNSKIHVQCNKYIKMYLLTSVFLSHKINKQIVDVKL